MKKLEDTGERLIPEGHHQTLTYGEHLSRYLAVTELCKDKIVLDIASGTGYGTKLLAGYAKKVFGVDYNSDAIDYAMENYNASNIKYIVGDATSIPLPDESVELVVSLETIEHLTDQDKFISEVKRVIKPGGQFVVSTPNDDEFIEGNEFHLHEFNLGGLQKLITKNFANHHFYYQGSYFTAALLDEKGFTKGGRLRALTDKTFGQPTEKAIYFLAIASDTIVEDLNQTVVISDAWSTKDDIKRDINHSEYVARLNEQINNLREKIEILESQKQKLVNDSKELELIKNSKGWKILQTGYKAKAKIRKNKQK